MYRMVVNVYIKISRILLSFLSMIVYEVLGVVFKVVYNICSTWFLDIRISTCYLLCFWAVSAEKLCLLWLMLITMPTANHCNYVIVHIQFNDYMLTVKSICDMVQHKCYKSNLQHMCLYFKHMCTTTHSYALVHTHVCFTFVLWTPTVQYHKWVNNMWPDMQKSTM